MRNGIAIALILLLASGVWFVRRAYPKAGDLIEETHAGAMDTNQPAMPATPAPADTKPPEVAASAPPPPPADTQPADLPPQTIPITDAVRESATVSNVTEVPNLMDDASSRQQEQDIFYKFRIGYDYTHFGRSGNTWHAGAQFNIRPETWYNGTPNFWETFLIPDITAEIGHAGIATTVHNTPTTGDGVRTDISLYWPWISTSRGGPGSRTKLSFGPVVYGAFQEITSIDIAEPDWQRYGGARLMLNHDAFLEYMVGKTDSLPDLRYQLDAEFPIYQKEGSQLRYVVHGMWNSSYSSQKDIYGVSVMVEFPFDALAHPSKFRDLVPFVK